MSLVNKCVALFVLIQFLVFSQAVSDDSVEEAPFVASTEDFDSERIAGGVSTTIETFPYQVLVSVANQTVCGGFIISRSWVATAAHCVDGALTETVNVRAGSSTLNSGGVLFTASQYVVHTLFNASRSNDFDFALVQINGTFAFSNAIKAIAIPAQGNRIPLLGTVTVAGWGLPSEGSTVSQTLRTASVKIVPQRLCRLLYRGTAVITDRMFCAGRLVFGGKGTCQGDVGGAAMYNKMAIGIASFGVTCGSPVFPAVFSNVASVTEWIRGIIGTN